jgi:eukaryotic-like serine/threonine-protein kinase
MKLRWASDESAILPSMNCPACHAAVVANRFCSACGHPLTDELGVARSGRDLLEGRSLRELCNEAPLPWQRVVELITAICKAVDESRAHIQDPDLAPDNIYLEERPGIAPRVKLVEASAAVMRGTGEQDTATGGIFPIRDKYGVLTPKYDYFPPERLMGKPLDVRTSVYAIGVVTYELLTGRLPFADAKGASGLITAQLKQWPMSPSALQPGIPPIVDGVVHRCLEKDPARRYADVTELAAALNQALR